MGTTTVTEKSPRSLFITIMKNVLHIAIYILLGLLLAFFINRTAHAAEPNYPHYPQYFNEATVYEDNDNPYYAPFSEDSGEDYSDPPIEYPPAHEPPSYEPEQPPTIDPPPTDYPLEPQPPADPTGRLLIHSRAAVTNIPLYGTIFSIHRVFDNALVAELEADIFGEALLELPVGDYFLRKIAVPTGFILNTDRINFYIRADEINTITVISHPEPIIAPPTTPLPGRLVIINRTDSPATPISGTMFAIYNAMNDQLIAEVVTNHFGEASYELPAGDFYIRQLSVPAGVVPNTDRVNFRILPGEVRNVTVTNRLQPAPTPPPPTPAIQYGRLIVTVRADDTQEVLQGAAFMVHNSLTDEVVAWVVTNRFGEASVQLPAGDFFLRQTATVRGYTFTTDRIPVRIQGNAVREITVTNRAEPPLVDTPPAGTETGRLLLFQRADGTRELLQGAVFTLHDAQTDVQIATLVTDLFGEATITLPAGNYYLRQIAAPYGFITNIDRINFTITANEMRELTVNSRIAPVVITPPDVIPGRVLVTVRAQGTGANLQGVDFSVHDILTDALVGSLTTDAFGEASLQLPAGDYFIRQTSTPNSFVINTDRIPVRIRDGAVTDIFVTRAAVQRPTPPPSQGTATATPAPTPPPTATPPPIAQGRIEIVTRAAGTGNPLSGGIYAVYRASDSHRIGQVTTGVSGTAYILAEPGMYFIRELRPTFGFLLEPERIFLEVGAGNTVTLELTKQRDFNVAYLPTDENGSNFVYIVQTGQFLSLPHYVGGGFLMLTSLVFVGLLVITLTRKRRDVSWQN